MVVLVAVSAIECEWSALAGDCVVVVVAVSLVAVEASGGAGAANSTSTCVR